MTKTEFIDIMSECGWDTAIKELEKETDNLDIKVLCEIYWKAYETEIFQISKDCDCGVCYDIREFAINKIIDFLED